MTESQPSQEPTANNVADAVPSQAAERRVPLVGLPGKRYIQQEMTKSGRKPQASLEAIQNDLSLSTMRPACAPLLRMLQRQGVPNNHAHKKVLESATAMLLERIPQVHSEHLRPLLDAVFPFLSIPQLRQVAVVVLSHLQPVPKSHLHQLVQPGSEAVFWELPLEVQRQVWETEVPTLRHHAMHLLHSFSLEDAVQRCMHDMLMFLPGAAKQGLMAGTTMLGVRLHSRVISRLVDMIGSSRPIYKGIVDLLRAKWAVHVDKRPVRLAGVSLCLLRRHLLLLLHGRDADHLCKWESVNNLAWALDGAAREGSVSASRLGEMRGWFTDYEAVLGPKKPKSKKRKGAPKGGDGDDASHMHESSAVVQDGKQAVMDAAILLRDPALLHLLAFDVLRHCYTSCAREARLPRDDAAIPFLLRLLHIGFAAPTLCREGASASSSSSRLELGLPEALEDALGIVLPAVVNAIVSGNIAKMPRKDAPAPVSIDAAQEARIVTALRRCPVCRLLAQAFVLERLGKRDAPTCATFLRALADALASDDGSELVEWAAFGASLARRLVVVAAMPAAAAAAAAPAAPSAAALQARLPPKPFVDIGDELWQVAFDRILLPSSNCGPTTHREVLALLDTFVSRRFEAAEAAALVAKRQAAAAPSATPLLSGGGAADADDAMRAAVQTARDAALETLATYIPKLLAASKRSRTRAEKHLERLMNEAGQKGVPADCSPWPERLPDGTKPQYVALVDKWPGLTDALPEDARGYCTA